MEIPPPHVLAQLDAIIVGQSSAANDGGGSGARATSSVDAPDAPSGQLRRLPARRRRRLGLDARTRNFPHLLNKKRDGFNNQASAFGKSRASGLRH